MNKPVEYSERYSLRSLGNSPASTGIADSHAVSAVSTRTLIERVRPAYLPPGPRDVLAQCPKCKTVETLQLVGDLLIRSRKFSQRDGNVYHDCGSDTPCHLHRLSPGEVGEKS